MLYRLWEASDTPLSQDAHYHLCMDTLIDKVKNELDKLTSTTMENKYEQKDMTGTLWMDLQTKQGTNGEYQAYTGSVKIFGKEMYINAYPKTLPSGKNLLSLTFREKQPKAPSGPMQVVDAAPIFNENKTEEIPLDSIPF